MPIVFCETRPLAQEWAYRFLGAALAHHGEHVGAADWERALPTPGDVPAVEPSIAEVRAWALAAGLPVSAKGRLRPEVWDAYRASR